MAIYTSMAEDTNSERLRINPASSQSGTRTRDHRVASPTLLPPGHAACYKMLNVLNNPYGTYWFEGKQRKLKKKMAIMKKIIAKKQTDC